MDEARLTKCAVLLVCYRLACLGIDAAPLSASPHVLARHHGRPVTLQIRAVESGSRTGRTCDWLIEGETTGDLIALVDVTSEKVWLMTPAEVRELSSVQPDGTRRLYTYAEATLDLEKTGHILFSGDFDQFSLALRADRIA